jgi:ribosomal protein S3AE
MGAIFRDEIQAEMREEVEDVYGFRELEIRKTELLD